LEHPLEEHVLVWPARGEADRIAARRAGDGFEQRAAVSRSVAAGRQVSGLTKVVVVVGALLPPSGSTLTATAPTRVASTGSATTATPSAFGAKVTLGAI